MPELPEVETTLQGIRPYVKGQAVQAIIIRQVSLRWKIPKEICIDLPYQTINEVKRRGKYLLFETKKGTAILHLGMSGSLKLLKTDLPPKKHDHFDIVFKNFYLRYNDPRRFGALLWTTGDAAQHPLIAHLGVEPLSKQFTAEYLHGIAKRHRITIKQFIMNHKIVVGVGNIYATESLFLAKIHPLTPANTITLKKFENLAIAIREVLLAAIGKGGTTLRDFHNSEGKPGYFTFHLNVYGREGESCYHCSSKLQGIRIQNRATVFCPKCQKLKEPTGKT